MSLEDLFDVGIPKIAGRGPGSGRLNLWDIRPIRIRLIPGEYTYADGSTQELLLRMSHWNNKKRRSHWCSSTWVMNAQGKLDRKPGSQCIGCHLSLDEGKRYVSTSAKFLATVLVLETYHLSPNDYNGNPLGVDDEGKQKYSKVLCEGDKCEYCKKGYKKTWGRKVRWEIPMTYLQTLREFVRTKRKHCANCGSRPDPDTGEGGLATIGLTCPNCEYQLEVQDPTVAEEIARSKARCPQCGSMVKYTELLLCSNCDEPRRPSIFDMDLWLMRTGQKPQYKLIISDYKIGPISKKALDEIHEAEKPLPLADIAEPMPLTAQCTLHEVPNPFVDNSNMVGEY